MLLPVLSTFQFFLSMLDFNRKSGDQKEAKCHAPQINVILLGTGLGYGSGALTTRSIG